MSPDIKLLEFFISCLYRVSHETWQLRDNLNIVFDFCDNLWHSFDKLIVDVKVYYSQQIWVDALC